MSAKLERRGTPEDDESQTFQLGSLAERDPERGEYIGPSHGALRGSSPAEGGDEEHSAPLLLQSREAYDGSLSSDGMSPAAIWEKRRSVRRLPSCLRPIWAWMQGPPYPCAYKITPLFERWQTAPGRIIDTYFPGRRQKMFLLLAVLLAWGLVFISVVDSSVHSSDNVVKISCSTRLW